MTQQPYYPPQPGYPPPPAPPVQPVAQPQYPAQPAQPYPPQYPAYPPQQYGAPPPAPAPVVPLAQGTLDDYYSQPSTGGGAGLKFTGPNNQPLVGQSYVVQVTRPMVNGDVQQQTDQNNRPLFFKDGRPKFVMIVPVQLLEPNPNHPDGLAKWYVKGAARDELNRAMAEAGAPEGPPEYGAVIRVTLTGTRPSGPGMNPAHVFAVQYVRPSGAQATAAPSPVAVASSQAPAAPAQQPAQLPLPPQAYPPGAAQLPPAAYTGAPAQQTVQQVAPPAPSELSPEQQALLAQLTQAQQA